MKKAILFLGLLIVFGCSNDKPEAAVLNAALQDVGGPQQIITVTEDDFNFRLTMEEGQRESNEPLQIYAELEYVGDLSEITIQHAASPISMGLEDLTRQLGFGSVMDQPLVTTTLKKGEAFVETYKFQEVYFGTKDEQYDDVVKQLKEGRFPTGEYKIHARANFDVPSASEAKRFEMKESLSFDVAESATIYE